MRIAGTSAGLFEMSPHLCMPHLQANLCEEVPTAYPGRAQRHEGRWGMARMLAAMRQCVPAQWRSSWNAVRHVTSGSYLQGDFLVVHPDAAMRIDAEIPHGTSWDVDLSRYPEKRGAV